MSFGVRELGQDPHHTSYLVRQITSLSLLHSLINKDNDFDLQSNWEGQR